MSPALPWMKLKDQARDAPVELTGEIIRVVRTLSTHVNAKCVYLFGRSRGRQADNVIQPVAKGLDTLC